MRPGGMKGPRLWPVAAGGEAEGSLILEVQGRVGSSPDNDEAGRTPRRSGLGKRSGKVYVRNQRLKASQSNAPAPTWGMRAGIAVHTCPLRRTGDSFGRYLSRRPGGHIEGLRVGVAMLQGHSWAPNPLTDSW